MSSDLEQWATLPVRLRWLTAIAIGVAALRLVTATGPSLDPESTAWFIGLLLISCVCATFKVRLPLPRGGSTMSLSYAVDFTALLLLGPDLACVTGALSTWSQTTLRVVRRNPPHKVLFSMAAVVLATASAGEVYALMGGPEAGPPGVSGVFVVAVLAATTAYFLVTTGLVAVAVAWSRKERPFDVWHGNFLWTAPGYFVGSVTAAVFVLALGQAWVLAAILGVVPFLLTYRSYTVYFRRLENEQRQVQEVSDLHLATVEALAAAIDAKDNAFTQHIRRVERLAERLARELGMSEADIRGVKTAALLHDIGKLAVPEYILSKPGPLTPEEFTRVQAHPRVGAEIISNVPFPYPVVPLVRSHHERWDGGGYPDGLVGESIPLGARVICVVDYYDALTCDRPYRRALSEDEALATLRHEAGRALDPRVVETFVALMPRLAAEGLLRPLPPPSRAAEPGDQKAADARAAEGQAHVFDDIARAHRELYVLYEIAQSMGRSLGIADTFALVASRLGALVPHSACALYLRAEDDTGGVRCVEASGLDAEHLRGLCMPLGTGNAGWVVRERQPLLNGDVSADLVASNLEFATSLRSVLVTPLVFHDDCIGSLAVFHTQPQAFRPEHQRFLERVSEQAAAVIFHSILFERTREDSLTDLVTGLPNARFLKMHAATELARAKRSGRALSLIVFDLDEFKGINDTYGHPIGDAALKSVSTLLSRALRPYDVCVRYAGDEFVIVLSDCTAAEAESKRRELQATAEGGLFDLGPVKLPLRLSAGCATYPADGDDYQGLLARADHRMYQDKAQRRSKRASERTVALASPGAGVPAAPQPAGSREVA